jgi:hypothetical protein
MILFAELQPVTLLFIAALAITTWLLLMRSHRYFTRQKEPAAPEARSLGTVREERGHHLDAPATAARWEVEMHDTARELSAQLDTKMSALQALIADADRAAARLETALGQASETSRPADFPDVRPVSQAEALKSPRGSDPPLAAGTTPAASDADRTAQQRRREEICTLADYGFTPAEIARRVGSPIGEVELILGLREKG